MKKKSKPIGVLIDKLYLQDQAIKKIHAELHKANFLREKLQAKLLSRMSAQELNGVRSKLGTAFVAVTEHPKLTNPKKFFRYVVANKAYDLLYNRVASKAFFARRDNKVVVPGVETTTVTKVSVRKAK